MSVYEVNPGFTDDAVFELDKPQDECGVVGVWAVPGEPVATIAYAGLHGVQHRGQSAAGLAVHHPEFGMFVHKGLGLVDTALAEVMPGESGISPLDEFAASKVAVGHTRYDTTPNGTVEAAQPFSLPNITLSKNGHVESLHAVAEWFGVDLRDKVSDTHGLTMILNEVTGRLGSIEKAMAEVLPHVDGGYCIVATDGDQLTVARDPWSIHPLALGVLPGGGYMVASESSALQDAGATRLRDIERGEILTIDDNGLRSSWIERDEPEKQCMIEYGYIKDRRSIDDGVNVRVAREQMGRFLAMDNPLEADIVMAVPNGGNDIAVGYSEQSRLPLVAGIKRNPLALRSFMLPTEERERVLGDKFNIDAELIRGKKAVIIDDSVIRGSTMKVLIGRLREAGATEVHVVSGMPHNLNPCYMGLATGNTDELIGRDRTDQEIADYIGADSIAYNTPARVEEAVEKADYTGRKSGPLGRLCTACATGEYPFEIDGKPETVSRKQAVVLGMPAIRQQVSMPMAGA